MGFRTIEFEHGDNYFIFDDYDYDLDTNYDDYTCTITLWGEDENGHKYEMMAWSPYAEQEPDWENIELDYETIIRC